MKVNVRKEAGIRTAQGEYLELDIWLPSLQLAFEFQVGHLIDMTHDIHNLSNLGETSLHNNRVHLFLDGRISGER